MYTNVTNVVARLSWPGHCAEGAKAVLVNAHFDSFVSSPGASDDGVGVAAMLGAVAALFSHTLHPMSLMLPSPPHTYTETARALAFGPPLNHPIIFLFNGAEEK